MKLVLIVGSGAVGKMTVGQELAKITGLKLFHNHMTIEPVIEIFGEYDAKVVKKLRDVIFEEFSKTENKGLIFTYMWAFDLQEDWDYIHELIDLFTKNKEDIYCVELIASQEVRLQRNKTENRIKHKTSKRNIKFSQTLIEREDSKYRLVSNEGEIPFENYLRIDNTHLSATTVAKMIKDKFEL